MTNPVNIPSSAFNVDRVRQQMLEGVRLPEGFLQKAIDKLDAKLNAKTTKFFSYRGEVQETVDVEDHDVQLAAVEKIMSISGLYARAVDNAPATPMVVMQMDPVTGVVSLIIGGDGALVQARPRGVTNLPPVEPQPLGVVATAPLLEAPSQEEGIAEERPKVIHITRSQGAVGRLPVSVRKALFDEEDP